MNFAAINLGRRNAQHAEQTRQLERAIVRAVFDGASTVDEIAGAVGRRPGTMAKYMERLECRGWLTKQRNGNTHVRWSCTEAGALAARGAEVGA
jgi:DNA-binding MarR family transcriptional regulator